MKKIILLIIITASSFFAQGWNNVINTSISQSGFMQMEILSNRDGIHIVFDNDSQVKYYLLNTSGTTIRSTTLYSYDTKFVNITGNMDTVFVMYYYNGYIRGKYSADAGQNWVDLTNIQLYAGNDCDGLDIVKDKQGVHVVWSEPGDGDEVYYYRYRAGDLTLTGFYNVTNYTNGVGSQPSITFSSDRIHVIFNDNYSGVNTRDYKFTSPAGWQTVQTLYSGSNIFPRTLASCDKLFAFYQVPVPGIFINLKWKSRDISGTQWSNEGELNYSVSPYQENVPYITQTYDGNMHITYDSEEIIHRKYTCSTSSWSDEYSVYGYMCMSQSLTSTSNDLYVVFRKYTGDNTVKIRQYDDYPLAPQGLAVNPYQQGNTYYAKLTWQLNDEPDVFLKESNAYLIERRIKLMDDPWGPWTNVYAPGGNVTEFIDYEVQGAGSERYYAEYRMRAIDYNNHYSSYSSTVMIGFSKYSPNSPVGGGLKSANKINNAGINNLSYHYILDQNYPNPFNPTTTIDYSIKSSGLVTLKVYDMLGIEVESLVNETKEPGNYSAIFNAEDLPSGIYVYKLSVNNFVDAKKLILLK